MKENDKTSYAKRASVWWNEFRPRRADEATDPSRARADAGAFARLRRKQNAIDALIEPLTVSLIRRIGVFEQDEEAVCRAAELAVLLAHVRQDDNEPVAARLRGPNADTPVMSPLRFQRLLYAEAGSERLTAFRRAVAMLGGRANVHDLANAYLNFDAPKAGQAIRVRWLLAYAGERTYSQHTTQQTASNEDAA